MEKKKWYLGEYFVFKYTYILSCHNTVIIHNLVMNYLYLSKIFSNVMFTFYESNWSVKPNDFKYPYLEIHVPNKPQNTLLYCFHFNLKPCHILLLHFMFHPQYKYSEQTCLMRVFGSSHSCQVFNSGDTPKVQNKLKWRFWLNCIKRHTRNIRE